MNPVPKDKTFTALLDKNNELLAKICEYKKKQEKNDSIWRERWLEEKTTAAKRKRRGTIITFMQISIALVMMYLGILEFNQNNPIVIDFGIYWEGVKGWFKWA